MIRKLLLPASAYLQLIVKIPSQQIMRSNKKLIELIVGKSYFWAYCHTMGFDGYRNMQ